LKNKAICKIKENKTLLITMWKTKFIKNDIKQEFMVSQCRGKYRGGQRCGWW
jgi:hypothetical protein